MKKNIDTGVPAFPRATATGIQAQRGMALRDYFAAKALQATIQVTAEVNITPGQCAKDAYKYADAMIAEREKEEA